MKPAYELIIGTGIEQELVATAVAGKRVGMAFENPSIIGVTVHDNGGVGLEVTDIDFDVAAFYDNDESPVEGLESAQEFAIEEFIK